jgi:serine/threonine protein kinase
MLQIYEVEQLIGSGSFGHVYRCKHIKTGKRYAIKEFKNKFSNRKKAFEMREIQILQKIEECSKAKGSHCPFILKADRIEFENKRAYAVFELMDMSLTQFLRKRSKAAIPKLDESSEIRVLMKQITIAIAYMHDELKIMHRDIKPDNIMVNVNPLVCKMIDFGTCKDCAYENANHTAYVSTRWYRAPECVLRSHQYSYNSDVFAVGCVMAELYLLKPLFPGQSEIDQLERIFKILGTPKPDQWREGYRLAEKRDVKFVDYSKKNLQKYLGECSDSAFDAIKLMLKISS